MNAIKEILKDALGRKLLWMMREADMLDIGFCGTDDLPEIFVIHIDTVMRLSLNDQTYTGTSEMDDSKDSVFDHKVKDMLQRTTEIYLQRMEVDDDFGIHLSFSNSMEIHTVSIPNSEEDSGEEYDETDYELWRAFYHFSTSHAGIVAYPERLVIEDPLTAEDLEKVLARIKKRASVLMPNFSKMGTFDDKELSECESCSLEELAAFIESNDLINIQISATDKRLFVGSSLDCKREGKISFEKRFYVGEKEFDSIEDLKARLMTYSSDGMFSVKTINGTSPRYWKLH